MGKLFLLIIIQGGLLCSQLLPSVNSAAVSYSNSVTEGDEFSIFCNPACILITKNSFGVSINPSPFGMKEMAIQSYGFVYNTSYLTFGSAYLLYGFELYQSQKLSIGFAKEIAQNIYVGISAIAEYLKIANYGEASNAKFNAGILYSPAINFRVGIALNNIFSSKITDKDFVSDTEYIFGLSYHPDDNLTIYFRLNKQQLKDLSVSTGVKMTLLRLITLRTGYSLKPEIYSCGVSLHLKYLDFNYSVQFHNYLTESHFLGVTIDF